MHVIASEMPEVLLIGPTKQMVPLEQSPTQRKTTQIKPMHIIASEMPEVLLIEPKKQMMSLEQPPTQRKTTQTEPIHVIASEMPEVLLIEPKVFGDERGFFFESWNQRDFERTGIRAKFVQDNHSRSQRLVLRGLHYQVSQPQGKLVRATAGVVFDVAVDIRRSSPTFGCSATVVLSASRHNMIWIPAGFAHGFLVLSECAEVQYKTTDYWAPEHERTISWNDPDLAIAWPLAGGAPVLSAKDAAGTAFRNAETFP